MTAGYRGGPTRTRGRVARPAECREGIRRGRRSRWRAGPCRNPGRRCSCRADTTRAAGRTPAGRPGLIRPGLVGRLAVGGGGAVARRVGTGLLVGPLLGLLGLLDRAGLRIAVRRGLRRPRGRRRLGGNRLSRSRARLLPLRARGEHPALGLGHEVRVALDQEAVDGAGGPDQNDDRQDEEEPRDAHGAGGVVVDPEEDADGSEPSEDDGDDYEEPVDLGVDGLRLLERHEEGSSQGSAGRAGQQYPSDDPPMANRVHGDSSHAGPRADACCAPSPPLYGRRSAAEGEERAPPRGPALSPGPGPGPGPAGRRRPRARR